MIDFTAVSRELRSIFSRRREILTFLGSTFAALGLFLQNVLHGDLPPSLKALEVHTFAAYSVMLLVPSLILALRLAKLNAGITINGILFSRLMQSQDFAPKGTMPARAPGPNVFGVSFQMFLLADLLAGFAATLLGLSLGRDMLQAILLGTAVVLAWVLLYLYFHYRAASFALRKSATDTCTAFTREQWETHQSGSLEDANHDMINILALVGLFVFSSFEGLSGLGKVTTSTELSPEDVRDHAPTAYAGLMALTCVMGLIAYLRLRLAAGYRSLELDPTDRPFRPLRLTDSLLGYMLLAFLFALSVHMLLIPRLSERLVLMIDVICFGVAVLAEQISLVIAGLRK